LRKPTIDPKAAVIKALGEAFEHAEAEECASAATNGALNVHQLAEKTGMSVTEAARALRSAESEVMRYDVREWETGPAGQAKAAKHAHDGIVYGLTQHRIGQQGWVPVVQE
jgi:alkyl hydroperoxide reductase subunit AhpF